MPRKTRLVFSALMFLTSFGLRSQDPEENWYYARGFYLNAVHSSLKTPIFRAPQNSIQVPVPQTVTSLGYAAGYEIIWEQFGVGAGLSIWNADVPAFAFDPFEGTGAPPPPTMVYVENAQFGLILFDMVLHALPWQRGPMDVFVHLGLGSRSSEYVVKQADQPFQEWQGPQSISEFEFSYGVGIRVKPMKFLSFIAEYRLAPGDLDEGGGSQTITTVYYNGGVSSYGDSGSFSKYTKILSLGVQATLEF